MSGVLKHLIDDSANSASCAESTSFYSDKRRKRSKNEYPIFAQWAKEVEGSFWPSFFMAIAEGNLPDKFYISCNQLVCNIGRRKAVNIHPNGMQDVIDFIRKTHITMNYEQDANKLKVEELTWTVLKKRVIQLRSKLDNWIDKEKKKYNLDAQQVQRLNIILNMAINNKLITNESVIIEEDEIVEFTNIKFDPKLKTHRILNNDKYKYSYTIKKTQAKTKEPSDKLWFDYLETIKNLPKLNGQELNTKRRTKTNN